MGAVLGTMVLAMLGGGMVATAGMVAANVQVLAQTTLSSSHASATAAAVHSTSATTPPGPLRGPAISGAVRSVHGAVSAPIVFTTSDQSRTISNSGQGTTNQAKTAQAVHQAQEATAPGRARGAAVSAAAQTAGSGTSHAPGIQPLTGSSHLRAPAPGFAPGTTAGGGVAATHMSLHLHTSAHP